MSSPETEALWTIVKILESIKAGLLCMWVLMCLQAGYRLAKFFFGDSK